MDILYPIDGHHARYWAEEKQGNLVENVDYRGWTFSFVNGELTLIIVRGQRLIDEDLSKYRRNASKHLNRGREEVKMIVIGKVM